MLGNHRGHNVASTHTILGRRGGRTGGRREGGGRKEGGEEGGEASTMRKWYKLPSNHRSTYVHTYVCMNASLHVSDCYPVRTYVRMYVSYVHIYIRIYVHMHIRIHTNSCTYIYKSIIGDIIHFG